MKVDRGQSGWGQQRWIPNFHNFNCINFNKLDKGPLINILLEDTACYAVLLLAPAEGFGLCSRQKRSYYVALTHFRPVLVSSSNLGNIHFHQLHFFSPNQYANTALHKWLEHKNCFLSVFMKCLAIFFRQENVNQKYETHP